MSNICEQCGRPLPADAPRGECPACLARAALAYCGDEPETAAPFALPFGRYELLGELGRGGMGAVFRARDTISGDVVAVKVLLAGRFAAAAEQERFAREAEAIAALSHPAIVALREVGEHAGQPFFAMDYLAGRNLAEAARDGTFAPIEAARCVRAIAEAVQHAHECGIIHRDLKPSNVLLDDQNQPHLTDFGLTRSLWGDSDITRTGDALGTPGYMAPEQVAPQYGAIGPASDVYSMGAILYFLLTGRPPFLAPTFHETVTQMLHAEPVPPSRLNPLVPRDLETICLKCLEKNVRQRYATSRDLELDLQRFLAGQPVEAQPKHWSYHASRWCRQRPVTVAIAATLFASLLVGGTSVSVQWRRAERARAAAETAGVRLAESVSRLRLERIEDLAADGHTSTTLELLGIELRTNPSNRVAAQRAVSLLEQHRFVLPRNPPLNLGSNVNSASFSLDGSLVGVAGYDMLARIFDLKSERPIGTTVTGAMAFYSVAFSGDGSRAAAGTTDGTVHIWELPDGRQLAAPLKHPGNAISLTFSPDGSNLLVAWSGYDSPGKDAFGLDLWDINSSRRIFNTITNQFYVLRGVFSPDGRRFAAVSTTREVVLRDSRTGRPVLQPLATEGGVHHVAFSNDGLRIAAADYGGCVRVWDTHTGDKLAETHHSLSALWVEFSPDGTRFITASEDQTARLFDLKSGRQTGETMHHDGSISCARFSSDGNRIVTGSADGSARLWDGNNAVPLGEAMRHDGPVTFAQFTPDGESALTTTKDNYAHTWDVRFNGASHRIRRIFYHGEAVLAAAVASEGTRVITVGGNQPLRIWNAESGDCVAAGDKPRSPVVAAWFSPNIRRVLTRSADNMIHLWNGETGKLTGVEISGANDAPPLAFSGDGQRFVVMLGDTKVQVFQSSTGQPLAQPFSFEPGVEIKSFAFSPDPNRLAVGYSHGQTLLWNIASDSFDLRPIVPNSHDLSVVFSKDGTLMAGGSPFRSALVWKADDGQTVAGPLPHSQVVTQVRFSPAGDTLLTLARDNAIRLWRLPSGVPLAPPLPHPGEVSHFEFSPDSARLLTVAGARIFRVWDSRTGRALTESIAPGNSLLMVRFDPEGKRVFTVSQNGLIRVYDAFTGLPMNEPERHEGMLTASAMSANGRWLVTADNDGKVELREPVVSPVPVPAWFPEFLEAVGGERLASEGLVQKVSVAELAAWRRRSLEQTDLSFYSRWLKWFFADPSTRGYPPRP